LGKGINFEESRRWGNNLDDGVVDNVDGGLGAEDANTADASPRGDSFSSLWRC